MPGAGGSQGLCVGTCPSATPFRKSGSSECLGYCEYVDESLVCMDKCLDGQYQLDITNLMSTIEEGKRVIQCLWLCPKPMRSIYGECTDYIDCSSDPQRPYLFGRTCIESCPGYSINNICVSECWSNMYVNGSRCVYQCPGNHYELDRKGSKKCQSESECNGYYYPDDGMFACVSVCNGTAPYIYTRPDGPDDGKPVRYC